MNVHSIGTNWLSSNGKAAGHFLLLKTDCTRVGFRYGAYQDISTVAGVSYTVTFDHIDRHFRYKQPLTTGNVYLEVQSPVGTSVLDVSHETSGDIMHDSIDPSVRGLWDSAEYTFTAGGTVSRVFFYVGARACPSIDNVEVRAAAAPTTTPGAGGGGGPRGGGVPQAVGDPHLTNLLGQRFDLAQPGEHVMVRVPKSGDSLIKITADVQRMSPSCSDIYIQVLNVTGQWVEQMGDGLLSFQAQKEGNIAKTWHHIGKVKLKVVRGKTKTGIRYLNLFTRNLANLGMPVGGLLGDADHTTAATPTSDCNQGVVL